MLWRLPHRAQMLTAVGFETIVTNYGTDIPSLRGDHKRYLYGPGSILVSHSDHEHVGVSDLLAAVDGYKTLILAALGVPDEALKGTRLQYL